MKKFTLILVLLMIFTLAFSGCSKPSETIKNDTEETLKYEGETLMVYSGAGLSKAMDEVTQEFEKKYGAKVNLNYASCAHLLSQMEINKIGDAFVGGSLNDMVIAKEKGFTDESVEVAYHIPAIAVPAGNPANITCLEDLAKPDIKLVLGDEKSNAIGKKGAKIFTKNQLQESISDNVVVRDATVNEIVTHIAMRQGDAGLIWEDNGFNAKDIEVIAIPEEQNVIDKVPVCVLNFTENQELAQTFADFVSSKDGKAIFVKHGFKAVE